MEEVLESFRNISDLNVVIPALNLMKVYFDNIAREPTNPKYRKIRVGNAKFNSTIWKLEEARMFFFLAGFEENDEFIVLPDHISVDEARHLLDTYANAGSVQQFNNMNTTANHEASPAQGPAQAASSSSTLKLAAPKGASYFDQDIKADLTLLSYMIEMGFDKRAAERALIATKNVGVQPAMDWISMNPQAVIFDEEAKSTDDNHSNQAIQDQVQVQSLASSSTGLTSAGDSRPAPVSRYQKTADERHKFQEKLRLEAIEAARTEKLAKQQHKQHLLKEMQQEKEEKKEKEDQAKRLKTQAHSSEGLCSTESTPRSDALPVAGMSQDGKTELRIRLPDGQVSNLSLSKDAEIKEIYRHVCRLTEMTKDDFVIMTTYPQIELADMGLTMEAAALTPRAALVVQRKDQHGQLVEGHGEVCTVKTILSMEDWQATLKKSCDKLLVAQFYTAWCANSRAIADRFESLNAEYGINQSVLFVRVDIEQLKVLKYQLQISTTPTFKLFWNEKEIAEQQGNNTDTLEKLIKLKQQGPGENETAMEQESNAPDNKVS